MGPLVNYKEFPLTAYPDEACSVCKAPFGEIDEVVKTTNNNETTPDLKDYIWAHKSRDGQSYQCFTHKKCIEGWEAFLDEQTEEPSKLIERCPSCTKKYSLILMSPVKIRVLYNSAILAFNTTIGAFAAMGLLTGSFSFNLSKLHPQMANPFYGKYHPQVTTHAELLAFQEAARLESEASSLLAARVIAAAAAVTGLIISRIVFSDATTKQKLIDASPLIVAFGITYTCTENILGGYLSVLPYTLFAGAIGGFIGGIKQTVELS